MSNLNKPKLKILCIDGGGMRGIVPCAILQEIEHRLNKPIASIFDLIAGTSTGGIIAVGLTIPKSDGTPKFSPIDLQNLYVKNGKDIFNKSPFKSITQFFSPGYSANNLENVLKQYFGDAVLKDAITNVLVPSLETISSKPFYFISRLAKDETRIPSENFLIRDVARSTSAAPTYFPANNLSWGDKVLSLVDGGTYANNPSILAFSEAFELMKWGHSMSHQKSDVNDRAIDPVVLADADATPFFLLSLGTGLSEDSISLKDAQKYGMINWVKGGKIINLVMSSTSESTHYEMQYVLPDYPDGKKRYIRINPKLWENHGAIDDASDETIHKLIELGNKTVKDNDALLDTICERLRD